jgi:hypothetical protein
MEELKSNFKSFLGYAVMGLGIISGIWTLFDQRMDVAENQTIRLEESLNSKTKALWEAVSRNDKEHSEALKEHANGTHIYTEREVAELKRQFIELRWKEIQPIQKALHLTDQGKPEQ